MRGYVALGAALWLVLSAAGAAATEKQSERNQDLGGGRGKQVIISLDYIPISTTHLRNLGIDWVVLADGQSTLVADASKGVTQEDQDKIDLSFIPVLGDVAGGRYKAEDMGPETRVGSAWIVSRILLLALDARRKPLSGQPEIVVLNQKSAFVMAAAPIPMDVRSDAAFAPILELAPLRDLVTTEVIVPEQRSILIGGLDQPGAAETASRVPGLSEIPALGRMFAGSVHQKDKSKLIILIRPSIIVSDD